MSRSYVCDHCSISVKLDGSKNQRPKGWGAVRLNLPGWLKDKTYQVCPACIPTIKKFLHAEEDDDDCR